MEILLKNQQNPVMLYSLESSHWALSDEYPFARISIIFFKLFSHRFLLAKLATSSIRVKGSPVMIFSAQTSTLTSRECGEVNVISAVNSATSPICIGCRKSVRSTLANWATQPSKFPSAWNLHSNKNCNIHNFKLTSQFQINQQFLNL